MKKSGKLSSTEDCERSATETWDFMWTEMSAVSLVKELLTEDVFGWFKLIAEILLSPNTE